MALVYKHGAMLDKTVPVLQRSSSIFRGLVFASRTGWERGFRNSPVEGSIDNISKTRGIWNSALSTNYELSIDGGCVDSGDSPPGFTYEAWGLGGRVTFGQAASVAFFGLRHGEGTAPEIGMAFGLKEGYFVPGPGISIVEGDSANNWGMNVRDAGGTEEFVFSSSNSISGTIQTVVGTWSAGNGLRLYIDGELRGTAATAITTMGTPSNAYAMYRGFDGECNAGLAWNRELSAEEVANFHTDPFRLWRSTLHNEFMFGPGMVPGPLLTYFLSF